MKIPSIQALAKGGDGWPVQFSANESKEVGKHFDTQVRIASFIGPYSSGKSHLLSNMLHYDKRSVKSFSWIFGTSEKNDNSPKFASGQAPTTDGIAGVMSGTQTCYLDTEGFGAPATAIRISSTDKDNPADTSLFNLALSDVLSKHCLIRDIASHVSDVVFYVTSRLTNEDQQVLFSLLNRRNGRKIVVLHRELPPRPVREPSRARFTHQPQHYTPIQRHAKGPPAHRRNWVCLNMA